MIQVARLHLVLDRVKARLDEWDQRDYASVRFSDGARLACYAGHAAVLAGDPPDWLRCTPEKPTTLWAVSGQTILEVAQCYLGLDHRSCSDLFSSINTLRDLEREVADLERLELVRAS